MKVAAFGCGKNYTSARFRVRQFIPDLADHGIDVHEYIAPIYKHLEPKWTNPAWMAAIRVARPIALLPSVAASHRYDASWIQKEMIWGRDTLERFTKRPRFFDVDDALWYAREGSAEHIARLAGQIDVVMAGNETIAEWFVPNSKPGEVRIIHTAVDADLFRPAEPGTIPDHPFTIVWTGQKVTLYHLAVDRAGAADLHGAASRGPIPRHLRRRAGDAVAPRRPGHVDPVVARRRGARPPGGRRRHHAARRRRERARQVRVQDAPVHGLRDCRRSSRRSGSTGTSCPIGEVGLGASTTDEWVDAFELLYEDRDAALKMGDEGRRIAVEQFDRPIIAKQIADLFHEVVRS